MLRNLTYRIPIREGADSIGLTRYLELEEGCDVNEEFLIETPRHSIGFIPAELVELRAAIDEMLRMAEQHRDALTDGAGEPDPDEALVLNRAEKEILRALAHGDALWLKNDRAGLYGAVASVKEASIKSLWDKRLIGPGDEPAKLVDGMEDGLLWYTISVKGRRVLAAQVPS